VVTLEFILAACIWFFTMLAIFQFGFLMLTLQVGHTALIEGTRKAAELYPPNYPFDEPNDTPPLPMEDNDVVDQVVQVLNEHLGVHGIEVPDVVNGLPDTTDGNARVIVQRRVGNGAVETADRGDATIPCMSTVSDADIRDDEVVVTLCIRLVDPGDPSGSGNPVPDWLATFGFSLETCIFEVSSRMRLE
jgi:hypothetical protein